MAEDMHEVVAETLDTIEDALDILEGRTSSWLANRWTVASLSGVLGLAIGSSVTYLLVAKKLAKKYQQQADQQVAEVKEHYSILRKDGEYSDPAVLAAKYETPAEAVVSDILQKNGYRSYDQVESTATEIPGEIMRTNPGDLVASMKADIVRQIEEPEDDEDEDDGLPDEPVVHLFSSDDPEKYWDWDEEKLRREANPEEPYVITLDEFNLNEYDFNQITLTYYDGDGVLVDDKDQPINDENAVVGTSNMLRFGHASNDRNVVYICNNRLSAFFEVLRSEGKYAEQVLGFIEHSDRPRLRRFRNYD